MDNENLHVYIMEYFSNVKTKKSWKFLVNGKVETIILNRLPSPEIKPCMFSLMSVCFYTLDMFGWWRLLSANYL